MAAKYPPFPQPPKGSMIAGNDDRHNQVDPNSGGSPQGMFSGNAKRVAPAQRGGVGHNGRDVVAQRASMGGGRGSSGNPASRGGSPQNFRPHTRNAGHGGSVQVRGDRSAPRGGGFGKSGQQGVPSYSHANPQPSTGNVSGRTQKLIAGRFTRKAMGARPSGNEGGRYGSSPVTANT